MITCASKIRIHLGEKDKELNPRMIGDQKLFRTLFRAVWKFWFQRSETILPLLIIIPIYSLVESHLFYKRNLEFGIVMGRELSKKVDISIAFFLYIHFLSSKFITPRREKKNRSESNYRSAYDFSPNNLRSSISSPYQFLFQNLTMDRHGTLANPRRNISRHLIKRNARHSINTHRAGSTFAA